MVLYCGFILQGWRGHFSDKWVTMFLRPCQTAAEDSESFSSNAEYASCYLIAAPPDFSNCAALRGQALRTYGSGFPVSKAFGIQKILNGS